jgi:hypothetical protein
MPPSERKSGIPRWAEQERLSDMLWIAENLSLLWPVAQAAYAELGRGAIVVDITSRPTGEGHPYAYFPQELVIAFGDRDAVRMVAQYDPSGELVTMLLKTENRVSTYRLGVPAQGSDGIGRP